MSYWSDPAKFASTYGTNTNPFGNFTVVDTVPQDMLPLVHSHWYQFPPMNPLWYGLLGFVITMCGLLSVCGNLIVVWVFMNTKALRSPANSLVVNLAFNDFLMMFCMFPPMVVNSYYGTWVFGPTTCQVYGFVGNLCGCVSIYTMVWITLDRYNVIVKGVSAQPLSQKGAFLRIIGTWIFSLVWTGLPFFGWNRYVPEGNMTACGTDYLTDDHFSKSYLYVYTAWVFFGPFLLIVFSYYHIVSAVFAHEKQMREQAKKMGIKSLRSEEAKKTSNECRLAKVALTTVSLWFMAWCPYLIINWAGMFTPMNVTPLFSIWGSLFAKANAVYNPIVYAISHPKYRAALQKKLPCLACNTDNGDNDTQSSATATAATEKAEESA
uniref:Opsin L18 n=1 Tax=Neogonodactylus oerstedii TaxID=85128 RepID=A0A6H0X1M8_NEOOE|nr:opsin L18 [Neogonodactylus oerstedii]